MGSQLIKILIIADDITGALDTGVQFIKYGIKTAVVVQKEINFEQWNHNLTEVLVVDVETRHTEEKQAYEIVYQIVKKSVAAGVRYLYKKTDSGLRGNISSELSAVLDASGKKFMAFVPAFPKMNRKTIHGVHFIDGVPLKASVFGQDPFEPVSNSYIPDMFVGTGAIIKSYKQADEYDTAVNEKTIGIFDAESQKDLRRVASHLKKENQLNVIAGCAGFADAFAKSIGFHKREKKIPIINKPLLVLCGSVNPISKEQINYAEKFGFERITLASEPYLNLDFLDSKEGETWLSELSKRSKLGGHIIIDTQGLDNVNNSIINSSDFKLAGQNIAAALGRIGGRLIQQDNEKTFMIIGGDTLLHFIEYTKCSDIEIQCEISEGVILSRVHLYNQDIWLISKSGGFGKESLLIDLLEELNGGEEDVSV